jgi:hypothetical protein
MFWFLLAFFGMSLFFLLRKKPLHPRVLIAIASFFPIISLLQNGVHQSGDFAVNIEKAIDLWHSLSYGIFPVGWASLLNASYGYPLFIFTYPLPYYSIAFFHMLGFSFISSEKIIIAIVGVKKWIFYWIFRFFFQVISFIVAYEQQKFSICVYAVLISSAFSFLVHFFF